MNRLGKHIRGPGNNVLHADTKNSCGDVCSYNHRLMLCSEKPQCILALGVVK